MEHVKIAKKFLINKNYSDFGFLLNETWQIKKSLSSKVTNPKIENIYKKGIMAGAAGGKLLGAGGGGFLLFYVKKQNHKKFKKNMSKYINIPFTFSDEGSKIIFDQENV